MSLLGPAGVYLVPFGINFGNHLVSIWCPNGVLQTTPGHFTTSFSGRRDPLQVEIKTSALAGLIVHKVYT